MLSTTFLSSLTLLMASVAGLVTIQLDSVATIALNLTGAVTSADALFRQSCPEEVSALLGYKPELLMSSFADFGADDSMVFPAGMVYPSSDSFIRGAVEAWAQHQHLILRPDEVWFEVLAQLNFYMSTHAEEIRDLFVSHEGKEEIQIWDFTWRDVIAKFAGEIQKRVKTEWLLSWIMPGFSTTNENDQMTATVLMMGLMQHYFEFTGGIICGLPGVTLLGTRDDWVLLLAKLNHLRDWGQEPTDYARNLRPIFQMFIRSWDEPGSEDVKGFWRQIVRAKTRFSCGLGPPEYDVTGWITGFLHWTEDGGLRVANPDAVQPSNETTTIGNVTYASQPLLNLPVGYAKVPLKMLDYPAPEETSTAFLLAGNVGVRRGSVKRLGYDHDEQMVPIANGDYVLAQPMSGWYMYAPVNASVNATTGPVYGSTTELQVAGLGVGSCLAEDGIHVQ